MIKVLQEKRALYKGNIAFCKGNMPLPRALLALEKPNSLVEAALVMNAELIGVIWDI
jgi:hypothetical protein